MSDHYHYCPICGCVLLGYKTQCPKCRSIIKPSMSKFEVPYYGNKAIEIYGDIKRWRDILNEEAKENPLYNEEKANHVKTPEELKQERDEFLAKMHEKQTASTNQPKCPTCGSTNIQRISTLKRAAHGYLFGLFSNTARSQFECLNCKYKF